MGVEVEQRMNRRKWLKRGYLLAIFMTLVFGCCYSWQVLLGFWDMPDLLFRSYIEVYPDTTYIRDIRYSGGTNKASRVRYYWTRDSIKQVKDFYNLDSDTEWKSLQPKDNLLGNLLRDKTEPYYFSDFGVHFVDINNKELFYLPLPYTHELESSLTLSKPLSGGTLILYYYTVPDP